MLDAEGDRVGFVAAVGAGIHGGVAPVDCVLELVSGVQLGGEAGGELLRRFLALAREKGLEIIGDVAIAAAAAFRTEGILLLLH